MTNRTPTEWREFDQSWGTNSAYVHAQHLALEWMSRRDRCVFCAIIRGERHAEFVRLWADAVAFVPLNPVVPGHTLVVPRVHIEDAAEDPAIAGATMARAASLAETPFNIITSAGAQATQTVWHLHFHIIPRRENDDLALPWSGYLSGDGL